MEIIEVRFVKDTQSVRTGNEFYPAGTRAHFYANQAHVLVRQGRAVIYQPPEINDTQPPAPVINYSKMTVKELKALVSERGIGGLSYMRKKNLIAALEAED